MTDFSIDDKNTEEYRLANAHRLEELPKERLVELLRESWREAAELRREHGKLEDDLDDADNWGQQVCDAVATNVARLREAAEELEDLLEDT